MAACGNNHVDTVQRLIEFGARPDLTDGSIAQKLGIDDKKRGSAGEGYELVPEARKSAKASIKLVQLAKMSKLLRCCNPKCGKPGYRSALKLCGRCKLTRYCSRDCQIQHWSVGHKKCCGQDKYVDEEQDPMRKVKAYLLENDKQNKLTKGS
ncbi:uncharacterized protein LOC118420332 [Branchiostoma floridae]|uniref:Uncharacterized protein LOC118420332 n=1 Tax=Branchiostoma floridae TaxID=7739 RepID=A0A9J7LHM3_BRAFL|nr:uncharacterized protein LOC118420332 [Branchiostoma floridae]